MTLTDAIKNAEPERIIKLAETILSYHVSSGKRNIGAGVLRCDHLSALIQAAKDAATYKMTLEKLKSSIDQALANPIGEM